MPKRKKIFLILAFSLFLSLALAGFSYAQRRLEATYPDIPGAVTPTTVKNALPEYVKYLFNFGIVISGLIAFGALIYGGFRWLTSVGNPSVLSDAKNQILSSFLGIVILFSSYLILTTINPQLIVLKARPEPLGGITLYKASGCLGTGKPIIRSEQNLVESYNMSSLKILAKAGELEVEFYENEDCSGKPKDRIVSQDIPCINKEVSDIKCVKMRWIPAGVYLCSEQYNGETCQGEEAFFSGDSATLKEFNNKAKSIKIRNLGGVEHGAVLHDEPGYKGSCKVFTKTGKEGSHVFEEGDLGDFKNRASSMTVFTLAQGEGAGEGITFYKDENFGGDRDGPYKKSGDCKTVKNADKPWATSMRMDPPGGYVAILFGGNKECSSERTLCQVFKESVPNFRKHPIGRCNCIIGTWGCKDCLTNFIILPTN